MQTVYGLTADNGDGSCSMHWFRDKTRVDELLDEDNAAWDERYYGNEGYPAVTLTFPDDLDLDACGFRFRS